MEIGSVVGRGLQNLGPGLRLAANERQGMFQASFYLDIALGRIERFLYCRLQVSVGIPRSLIKKLWFQRSPVLKIIHFVYCNIVSVYYSKTGFRGRCGSLKFNAA